MSKWHSLWTEQSSPHFMINNTLKKTAIWPSCYLFQNCYNCVFDTDTLKQKQSYYPYSSKMDECLNACVMIILKLQA